MIGSVGVEIDVDRADAAGDVRRDEQEVAAMWPVGPLITVEDPTSWIVGNVAAERRPCIAERRRVVLARGQKPAVMTVAGSSADAKSSRLWNERGRTSTPYAQGWNNRRIGCSTIDFADQFAGKYGAKDPFMTKKLVQRQPMMATPRAARSFASGC